MKNIIEINGRKYDAQTGKLISSDKTTSTAQPNTPPKLNNLPKNIDGISKKPASVQNPNPKRIYSKITTVDRPQPNTKRIDGMHKAAATKTSHKIQKSVTLSRSAVKKPAKTAPYIHAKSIPQSSPQKRTENQSLLNSQAKKVPEARIHRAMFQAKSKFVSKFPKNTSVKPQLHPNLTVQKAPLVQEKEPGINKTNLFETNISLNNKAQKTLPIKHEHIHRKRHNSSRFSKKVLGFSTVAAAILLVSGFFVFQTVPEVAIWAAASKSHVAIKTPGTTLAGFAFKAPVQADKTQSTITYKSKHDDSVYTITQKPTDWSSESLMSNYLIKSKLAYQTYYSKGMTVFVYNNSSATWVDKGIWFTLEAKNGTLSSEQILAIASSL